MRHGNSAIVIVVGLLMVGSGVGYGSGRLGLGTFVIASGLSVVLGVLAGIFLRRMTHPDRTVEQMLYEPIIRPIHRPAPRSRVARRHQGALQGAASSRRAAACAGGSARPHGRRRLRGASGFVWKVAGSTGLEPATSGVTGQRSNQLNYDPAMSNCQLRAGWSAEARAMSPWLASRSTFDEPWLASRSVCDELLAGQPKPLRRALASQPKPLPRAPWPASRSPCDEPWLASRSPCREPPGLPAEAAKQRRLVGVQGSNL